MVTTTRPLSAEENWVLRALAAGIDRKAYPSVFMDIEQVRVRPINSDNSILELVYSNYERPDQAQMQTGFEGILLDCDDIEVLIILYWDRNCRLCELEFVKIGRADLISPRWDSFHLKGLDTVPRIR